MSVCLKKERGGGLVIGSLSQGCEDQMEKIGSILRHLCGKTITRVAGS